MEWKDYWAALIRHLGRDFSSLLLILFNLITIALAVKENWSFPTLLWIYWTQSVIIGVFNVFKILSLENFSTAGFYVNNKPVPANEKAKQRTALFFALHYGLFHAGYVIFLLSSFGLQLNFKPIILAAIIFSINHGISFWYNRKSDRMKNLGTLMFFPYARIIPMHLVIVFGMSMQSKISLIFFLSLKTLADLIMHLVEHAKPLTPKQAKKILKLMKKYKSPRD